MLSNNRRFLKKNETLHILFRQSPCREFSCSNIIGSYGRVTIFSRVQVQRYLNAHADMDGYDVSLLTLALLRGLYVILCSTEELYGAFGACFYCVSLFLTII